MPTYALHYSPVQPEEAGLEEHIRSIVGRRHFMGLYEDGDSFLEWGEPVSNPGDWTHTVVEFFAPSTEFAWLVGSNLWARLVADGKATVLASCHAEYHVPFAVSLFSDFGCTISRGGRRTGDMIGWAHA